MSYIISGIQQIGIGVGNVKVAWRWYRDNFGMNIRMFEEAAMAEYMLPYTGGKPRQRHAALTINLMGGGGFEIWQYTERTPQPAAFEIQAGDLGIFAAKLKTPDVKKAYGFFNSRNLTVNGLVKDPAGKEHFFVRDPFGNIFQIVESDNWFRFDRRKLTGAAYGAVIGTSDIDKARQLYSGILGYDQVVYDETGHFGDYEGIPGGNNHFRRVLLRHSKERLGIFSRMFGPSEIELIQVTDRQPVNIFKDRYWGDLGFIHLCYDVTGIKDLKLTCADKGFPFTVDSDVHPDGRSFDMGEAAGHFAYIEDPDGTLIEFVETHKIPVSKKLGWYLNLTKRKNPEQPLPDWILKFLKYSKVRERHLA
ncbi:MAG: VOC family protein [Bacteroidota bacterium]